MAGTILLSSGDAKTEHYLLSAPFRVREPALLLFDYFESSLGPSHLGVYSRDLATLIWKPAGKEAGWQQAVATLAPGKHQVSQAPVLVVSPASRLPFARSSSRRRS